MSIKQPALLLSLVLFAALPTAAEIKPGDRCDTVFLEKVANDSKVGAAAVDQRIGIKSVNGTNIPALKFNDPKICDAGTWRHLGEGTPPVWRNAEAGRFWDAGGLEHNAALLLVADEFFKTIDPKAAEVLAAADEVIEAGVQLGVITTSDTAKTISVLLKGASGGPLAALKPRMVVPIRLSHQTGNLPPEVLGPVLRKLHDETGEVKGGGEAVMRFRLAVLALTAELGRLGASNAAVVRHTGAALPAVMDFMPGLPNGYVLPEVDRATALNDAKFGAALAALIGAGAVPALDDASSREGSLLESADVGLRNLVAHRSAEVEKIVAAAGKRLFGKRISQIEFAAREAAVVRALPANSLTAAVIRRLETTPEYAQLDEIYDMNWREQGDVWVNSPAGHAMAEVRGELRAAALSARIENVGGHDSVVFTQGGKKTVLGSLVPATIQEDYDARASAAAIVSRFIIRGAIDDAKYQAVVDAITGTGEPGEPLDTGLRGPEIPLSKEVPFEPRKSMNGADDIEIFKDALRYSRGRYEARRREADAETAAESVRLRNDLEKKRLEALANSRRGEK